MSDRLPDGVQLLALIGPVFVAVGVFILVKAVIDASRRRRARARWPAVEGTVVSETTDSVAGTPISRIEFTTLEGRTLRATTTSVVKAGVSAEGKRVRVHYDPADPERVVAHVHAGDSSGLPGVLLGATLALLGAVVTVLSLDTLASLLGS